MTPVASTSEILAFKMLDYPIDKRWVNWAYDMIVAGFETDNLIMLAGETEPFNQFELRQLTDKIFQELNLDWHNRKLVFEKYINYLTDQILANKANMEIVLEKLKDICIMLNYEMSLFDFYLLYFAKEDLRNMEFSFHWPDATRGNIDQIIMDNLIDWKKKNNTL